MAEAHGQPWAQCPTCLLGQHHSQHAVSISPPRIACAPLRPSYSLPVPRIKDYAAKISDTPLGWELLIGQFVMLGAASVFVVRQLPHVAALSRDPAIALALATLVFLGAWAWFWILVVGRKDRWQPLASLLLVTVAMIVAIWANPIGIFPFYYVVVLAGASYRWPYGIFLTLGATAYAMVIWWSSGIANRWTLQGIVILVGLGVAAVLVRRFVEVQLELHYARREVERLATAHARTEIARGLHDQLGQDLTFAVLQSELLREDLAGAATAAHVARADVVVSATRNALDGMRNTVTGLRSPTLAGEMDNARRVLMHAGFNVETECDPSTVDPTAGHVLAWVLRELVTNTVRHSGGSECRISLARETTGNSLTVADNGSTGNDHHPGNGLTGIHERVRAVGGSVDVLATPHGFRVHVLVPTPHLSAQA